MLQCRCLPASNSCRRCLPSECPSQVEEGAMVAAGAVVAPGTVVRSGEIWGGEVACLLLALYPCAAFQQRWQS
jgi:hypothetical protein